MSSERILWHATRAEANDLVSTQKYEWHPEDPDWTIRECTPHHFIEESKLRYLTGTYQRSGIFVKPKAKKPDGVVIKKK